MFKPILYFLLLLSITSFAQEKKIEVEFKSPRSAMGLYNTYSFANKERNKVCILAIGGQIVRGYILDDSYVLLKEFETAKPEMEQVLVGGFFRGDTIHYLLARSSGNDEIAYCTYNLATGINTNTPVDLGIKRSMFLGGLSLGDQFLFVSLSKKDDRIMVYRFGKNTLNEKLEFNYPAAELGRESLVAALSKTEIFSRSSEVSYVNDWESLSIERAKNYCKMYHRNDSILITIDREPGKIYVLQIDLEAQKITSRKIERNASICPTEFNSSSFLLDNTLYSVLVCRDALQLLVYDFYSGKVIKEYQTQRDEEISFRNTDIIQEESSFFSSDERKLEKTKQLLRKMVNGRALITARNTDAGDAELTIGSFKEVKNQGGGMMMPMGGAMGRVTYTYMSYGFSRDWTMSARFKTLLNKQDFEKVNGEVEKPLDEKIDTYTKKIKIPDGCEGVYPVNKKLAYYYLDRKQGKLVISSL